MAIKIETDIVGLTALILVTASWLVFGLIFILPKKKPEVACAPWASNGPIGRVIEGHELITEGPYGIVRNPIYLGMFGLMVATGLVVATWWALLLAVVIFLIGNGIRIREEENLLREAFGAKFDEYKQRVPAFLPRIG